MDYEKKLQELYHKFMNWPEDIESIANFLRLSKRLGLEIPDNLAEIKDFTQDDIGALLSYIEAQAIIKIGRPVNQVGILYLQDRVSLEFVMKIIELSDTKEDEYLNVVVMLLPEFISNPPTDYNKNTIVRWAEKMISRAVYGDPSTSALVMLSNYNISYGVSRQWAESVIENDHTGSPSNAAYRMYLHWGSDLEWLISVVENDKISQPDKADPAEIASIMATDGLVNREWAEQIIEDSIDRAHEPFVVIQNMLGIDSSEEWGDRVIAKLGEESQ